jgi:hypothetical protein
MASLAPSSEGNEWVRLARIQLDRLALNLSVPHRALVLGIVRAAVFPVSLTVATPTVSPALEEAVGAALAILAMGTVREFPLQVLCTSPSLRRRLEATVGLLLEVRMRGVNMAGVNLPHFEVDAEMSKGALSVRADGAGLLLVF